MWEIDIVVICQVIAAVLLGWMTATQIVIPLQQGKPLFPAFRKKDAVKEIQEMQEAELRHELELARFEEERIKLEAEIAASKKSIEAKREEIRRTRERS